MNKNVLIAGVGLIGGSLMKAIHQEGSYRVLAYDTNEAVLEHLKEHHIADEIFVDFEKAALKADIIILAAPISASIQLLQALDGINLEKDLIVSDVSSVKGTIYEVASRLKNNRIHFIGGHPMAGSHKTGIEAARAHLFENAIYVLTPLSTSAEQKIKVLQDLLKPTKSKFLILHPEEHDEMTSVISHFPHLVAASLVHQAKKWEQIHAYLPELAAGGFRDITRIASSNPKMWQDIFLHNDIKLSRLLQDWINEMVTLKEFLDKHKKDDMIDYLNQAKTYRDGLNQSARGALPSYYDIYIDVKDQPGAIANVVQLVANAEISLRNIRILEIRDNINGALRLSVTSKSDQEKAYTLLKSHAYDVTIEI